MKSEISASPLRSTFVVGFMTLLSRVLGMARDMVFAHFLGANAATDAFFVAFRIPNLTRRMFAEGAFAQAFVPVLAEYKTHHDLADVRKLLANVVGTLLAVLMLFTTFFMIVAPVIVLVFGFGRDQAHLTTLLIRITFPYALFISLVSCAGGILNSYGRFAVPAVTPVLLNVMLILATLFLAPLFDQPVIALAWGVFLAGLVQVSFQLPFLAKLGLLVRPRWGWSFPGVRKIVRLMIPSIIGSSAAQINIMVGTVIATYLASGSISWLYYADRLVEFPLGVFGIAISTVILPRLSQQHVARSSECFSATLDWALKLVVLFGTPATLGLILLSGPLVSTIFRHGAFDATSVRMAASGLIAYSVGLQGFILVKVLAPGFFSRQDTRTPMRFGMISVAISIVLSLILVIPFAHVGLAMATSLSALVNAALLFITLIRHKIYTPSVALGWRRVFGQTIAASGSMSAVLLLVSPSIDRWLEVAHLMRALWLAGLVLLAVGVYFLVLWVLGMRISQLKLH
jgi:putative peptidoglycan lipid II flippase